MSLYSAVKAIYKKLLPRSMRAWSFRNTPMVLKKLRRHLIRVLEQTAEHDEIYDVDYYNEVVEKYMAESSDTIADTIIQAFSPRTAVDVGCGTGLLLLAMKSRGVSVHGLEYSQTALSIARQRGIDVTKFDLEHDTLPSELKAEVVISTEVAEHLPESCADRFVDILCAIAPNVVLTAAQPGASYTGTDHVNEQTNEYWIAKFGAHNLKFEGDLTYQWRQEWKTRDVSACYLQNVMVFRNKLCDHV